MEVIFDFIIYFYLGVIGIFLIHQWHHWNQTKKNRFSVYLFFVLFASWVIVFYGSFVEPRMLVVKQEQWDHTPSSTQTLRAVVFSDLHVGPFKKQDWTARVVERIMELKPDIIFIPGDFVVSSADDVRHLGPLSKLSAPFGVYAVTGNHEYHADAAPQVIEALERAGIEVLENETLDLEVNGKILRIAGVSDIWFDGDFTKTMQDVKEEDVTLLLSHNPDVMLMPESRKADVVFAGHTHGGQIRLPWIGPVPRLPTKLGRAYDKGWFNFDDVELFITSGVGESGTRARLFNLPEIIEMNISF